MPTYRYKCEKCGYSFERFYTISTYEKETECPICHAKAKLLISGGSGLIFKGNGFYITDYKRKNNGDSFKKGKKSS